MTTLRFGLPLAILAFACDGLGNGDTEGPPLMTVHGVMVPGDTSPSVGELRLALAWYPGFFDSSAHVSSSDSEDDCWGSFPVGLVAQELAYEPVFPVEFRFDITAPPPPDAQVQVDEDGFSGKVAIGTLLAYEDQNGSGGLDPCPFAGPCPDRVLGASSADPGNVIVFYLEHAADLDGVHLEAGLNLIRDEVPEVLPPDTTVRIELDEVPEVQQMACEEICLVGAGSGGPLCPPDAMTCVPETPPIPDGAVVECSADGRTLTWTETICESVCSCVTSTMTVTLSPDDPIPADWPCPTS